MRVVYVDIDTLRADHLGCYGYPRDTTPRIDDLAANGVRLDNVYASDTPCLPSRTALSTGRFGTHSGVVGHGGTAAELRPEGAARGLRSRRALENWVSVMQKAGMHTVSLSTFPERHSAFQFLSGFEEWHNLGSRGLETADQVAALAASWVEAHAAHDDWFLHVHLWDPHTPYRTPTGFGEPFAGAPMPSWLTEEVRVAHWGRPGPHSAQEVAGFGPRDVWNSYPRQPVVVDSMDAVRRMFDGYDTGVRFADHHVGLILDALRREGVDDETAVIVSSDHGETLGELGIYCDHQTADEHVAHVPAVLRWPGVEPRSEAALHYQIDLAATVLELLDLEVPPGWDGRSFAPALLGGGTAADSGRDFLVLTHGAWTAQRAVRFENWICIFTYDDGYHGFPPVMLYDLAADVHEQDDQSVRRPDVVTHALNLMQSWMADVLAGRPPPDDPLATVMAEGGPWHAQQGSDGYLERLRTTGRGTWASAFAARGGVNAPTPDGGIAAQT